MANLNEPSFTERERDGFRSLRWHVGDDAGSQRLGASLWEVPPGEAAYPYHWHYVDEELIVVLAGRPSLRTPAGWRELAEKLTELLVDVGKTQREHVWIRYIDSPKSDWAMGGELQA